MIMHLHKRYSSKRLRSQCHCQFTSASKLGDLPLNCENFLYHSLGCNGTRNLLGYEALCSSDRARACLSSNECVRHAVCVFVSLYDKAFSGRQEEGHKKVMRSEIERAKKSALCLRDTSPPIPGVIS